MTIHNFLEHWIKEIDIKQCSDKISVLLLINTVDIYKYSDAMLKFEEDNALKTYHHHLLYSKKQVKLPTGKNRRSHKANDADAGKRTDDNLDDRINKFADQPQTESYYRIPLRFLCSLGIINQPVKFNTKWLLTFDMDHQRLFESKANQANGALPDSVDAKIILMSTPYIFYKQLKLDDNYRTYLEGIMISNNVLRTGIQPASYQKCYKMVRESQSRTVTFKASAGNFLFKNSHWLMTQANNISLFNKFNKI